MVVGSSWSPTRYIYRFPNVASSYSDLETMANALLTRDHVVYLRGLFLDGKRASGYGTFMRVANDMAACKTILNLFLEGHAAEYYPLPYPTIFILLCAKISDNVHGKPASDVAPPQ
jgi:hypothetical protein